ncbi:MAG: putative lipoprotein [Methylococcus sp.]|jgi:hypothetical protein|nr:MAG: putative lipoprotein [Methylococcus sp.]
MLDARLSIKGPAVLFFSGLLTACSISDSSVSISGSLESSAESSSSPFKSSSPKEAGDKAKSAYTDDVANLTASIAGSKMSADDFANALSRTAAQSKISDWADETATFTGIGKGLQRAGIAKQNIGKLPYLQKVLSTKKDALRAIEEGYQN